MKKAGKILLVNYFIVVALALLIIVCGENDWLNNVGVMHDDKSSDFIMTSIMEIITICLIPISLRLFKFKKVREEIISDETVHHGSFIAWAIIRLDMLQIPMVVNAVLYYLYMNVAFGYMGIILFLASFFIFPTEERCHFEYEQMKK
jgi:membrane protein YdbS with pleckstrin-like domain